MQHEEGDLALLGGHGVVGQAGARLVLMHTDYHSVVQPILQFIRRAASGDRRVMVLIPTIVPKHWRHRLLHNQIDLALSSALAREPDVVVARSRFRIEE